MITKNEFIEKCQKRLAQYPQYEGYYGEDRGWRLAVATKKMKFKGGDIEIGETVLARAGQSFDVLKAEKFEPISAIEIAHLVEAWKTSGGYEFPAMVHNSLISEKTALKSLRYLE